LIFVGEPSNLSTLSSAAGFFDLETTSVVFLSLEKTLYGTVGTCSSSSGPSSPVQLSCTDFNAFLYSIDNVMP